MNTLYELTLPRYVSPINVHIRVYNELETYIIAQGTHSYMSFDNSTVDDHELWMYPLKPDNVQWLKWYHACVRISNIWSDNRVHLGKNVSTDLVYCFAGSFG